MRYIIIRKADPDTEAGVMPSEALLKSMAEYNASLIEAGILLDGMGLHPTSAGARVQFANGKPVVTDGPFAETKELLAGFTLIQVQSKEEALEWVKRWPAEDANGNAQLELRRVYEMADFEPGPGLEHHKENFARINMPVTAVTPYLTFNGNCRTAFETYASLLGGSIQMMMSHGESPICDQIPAAMHGLIMHACLKLGNQMIMGSDAPPHLFKQPQGTAVSLSVTTPTEAERVFSALADNGSVTMPMNETFWAQSFGMLTDRFGISWMISCEKPA